MLPSIIDDIDSTDELFEEEIEPSYTHLITENRIIGYVDGLDAVKQAVYLILNIERYQYLIYSWDYGVELQDLMGEPISFVKSEIKRRITEALLVDDRIDSVENFIFDTPSKNVLHVEFTVNTIYGIINAETEVNI